MYLKSDKKIQNKLWFIIDENDPDILASYNYLSWLYGVIFKIPIKKFTEQTFIDTFELEKLKDGIPCTAIFLLLLSTGKKPKREAFWDILISINQKIPLVAFYRAAKILSKNSIARSIFNFKYNGESTYNLKNIQIHNILLKKNIDTTIINEEILKKFNSHNNDQVVFIENSTDVGKENEILLTIDNKLCGLKSGLNIFIGQKYISIPREDYALEFNRVNFYLNFLNNLLNLFPVPIFKLQLQAWPICFRIDDLPSHWNLIHRDKKSLNFKQISELIEFSKKIGLKITAMITPAYFSKEGKPIPWIETEFKDIINILKNLKDGVTHGVIDVGIHGLTHITLGLKPKFHSNKRLDAFFNILLNQKYIESEFYDRNKRSEIPYIIQETAIKEAKKLIQDYFEIEPKIFTPPQHMWDNNTEIILSNHNIPFLSCDMCFYTYSEKQKWRKNPSPIGSKTITQTNIIFLSGTIITSVLQESVRLFHDFGIPFILVKHNWFPETLEIEDFKKIISYLEPYGNKVFMSLSELGWMLKDWSATTINVFSRENLHEIELDIRSPSILEIDSRFKIDNVHSDKNHQYNIHNNKILLDIGLHKLQLTLNALN